MIDLYMDVFNVFEYKVQQQISDVDLYEVATTLTRFWTHLIYHILHTFEEDGSLISLSLNHTIVFIF
jgi:hypothetical protein